VNKLDRPTNHDLYKAAKYGDHDAAIELAKRRKQEREERETMNEIRRIREAAR
jgi:hypothetical protein